MKEKDYRFEVTGGFVVEAELEPVLSFGGDVVGFKLPGGQTARLVVALEVESP